jgi:hypothetical protein
VRVAAHHWRDAGRREPGDVFGHHDGGAAQEAVRRGDHAADPDRDEALDPATVAGVDEVDRVGPVRWWAPLGQLAAGHLLAQGPSEGVPLGPRHWPLPQRPVRSAVGLGENSVPATGVRAVRIS